MGATTFCVTATGKTVEAAFRDAVKAALHEHGHGGYSGTIAEKQGFVIIDAAAEVPRLVEALKGRRAGMTVAKMPGSNPAVLAGRRAHVTYQIRALRSKKTRAGMVASAMLDFGDRRVDDKWGPAGCVEVKRGEWIFFGWASS